MWIYEEKKKEKYIIEEILIDILILSDDRKKSIDSFSVRIKRIAFNKNKYTIFEKEKKQASLVRQRTIL